MKRIEDVERAHEAANRFNALLRMTGAPRVSSSGATVILHTDVGKVFLKDGRLVSRTYRGWAIPLEKLQRYLVVIAEFACDNRGLEISTHATIKSVGEVLRSMAMDEDADQWCEAIYDLDLNDGVCYAVEEQRSWTLRAPGAREVEIR